MRPYASANTWSGYREHGRAGASGRTNERMVSQALKLLLVALSWACVASVCAAQSNGQVRILLSIGQDIGAPGDQPLRYAERDAERFAQVLTSLGEVALERAYLLRAASAEDVRRAVAEIRGRSSELTNVVLITYVSSHADDTMLHLGSSQLAFQELTGLLATVPARLRVLIVDACTSGSLIRSKGGRPVKPSRSTTNARKGSKDRW